MKNKIVMGVVALLALALAFFLVITVTGDDGSMFNWYDECGYTCYQWADGSGDCYPCLQDGDCPKPTPPPEPTPPPTDIPPTKIPPTETPPPTKKPACNRGLGNGPEDCDPGNSGGKPGAAGEDNE